MDVSVLWVSLVSWLLFCFYFDGGEDLVVHYVLRLVRIRRRLCFVRHLNLSHRILKDRIPGRVNCNRNAVNRFNFQNLTSANSRASCFIVIHRLPTRALCNAPLLNYLGTNGGRRRVPIAIRRLAVNDCRPPIITWDVRAARIPQRTSSYRVMEQRFVFRRVRSQVAMYSLGGRPRA